MPITHLASLTELNRILDRSKDKLSVIDFHADWCQPCHMIAPTFEALSKQYSGVNFMKCDVEKTKDVAAFYRASSLPTFIFLKGHTQVDMIRGVDRSGLISAVQRHSSGSSTSAFYGKGQTLGGSTTAGSSVAMSMPDLGGVSSRFSNLDPQLKVLLGLGAAYALFLYMS